MFQFFCQSRPSAFAYQKAVCLSSLLIVLLSIPAPVNAEEQLNISLEPYCDRELYEETIFGPVPSPDPVVQVARTSCPTFEVEDPETVKTPRLIKGDTLDIQITVANPERLKVHRIRSWLSYDPDVLQGESIDIIEEFPVVTPGESDFDDEDGYTKIEASAKEGKGVSEGIIRIARMKFTVKKAPQDGTYISFYDTGSEGHTLVTEISSGEEKHALTQTPGTLHVVFTDKGKSEENTDEQAIENEEATTEENGEDSEDVPFDEEATEEVEEAEEDQQKSGRGQRRRTVDQSDDEKIPNGESCSIDDQCQSGMCASGICIPSLDSQRGGGQKQAKRTAFSLLQVRNLRASTEGSSIFLAWDPLKSSALKAYNVYYGTTSGRYIQRRTIPEASNTLTLRALPVGTTYFIGVRAVSKQDEESAFSKEVSIVVGDPDSSTALLVAGIGAEPAPGNPLQANVGEGNEVSVPGETGAPPIVTWILIGSAVIGTIFAARRQMAISQKHPFDRHE